MTATVFARRLEWHGRTLLAVAVLVLPAAISLPETVRDEVDEIRSGPRLQSARVEVSAPFMYGNAEWPADWRSEHKLVLIAERVVPPNSEIGVRKPETGWARRFAFALAPRMIVKDAGSPWLILRNENPSKVGVTWRRSWRFGGFWLVER